MTNEQYIDYLKFIYVKKDGNRLSDSSVKHYGNEAMRLINEKLRGYYGSDFSIYEIDNITELRAVKDFLFQEQNFAELDSRGNRMYSAGMNRYVEYAEGVLFRGLQDSISALDKPEKLLDNPLLVREKKKQITEIPNRSRIKIIQSEQAYNYTCHLDSSHKTFIVDRKDFQYMEGHHIIPLRVQDNFEFSLDCYANILVLCPTCHRFFHYGEKNAIDKKLRVIYDERGERLEKSGINLSQKEFLEMVNTMPSKTLYSYF